MGVALCLGVVGVLIAGFFLVTILLGGRNLALVVPATVATMVFGAPVLAISLSLIAMANEEKGS